MQVLWWRHCPLPSDRLIQPTNNILRCLFLPSSHPRAGLSKGGVPEVFWTKAWALYAFLIYSMRATLPISPSFVHANNIWETVQITQPFLMQLYLYAYRYCYFYCYFYYLSSTTLLSKFPTSAASRNLPTNQNVHRPMQWRRGGDTLLCKYSLYWNVACF